MKTLIFVFFLIFGVTVFLRWMRGLVMSDPQLTASYLETIKEEHNQSSRKVHLLSGKIIRDTKKSF